MSSNKLCIHRICVYVAHLIASICFLIVLWECSSHQHYSDSHIEWIHILFSLHFFIEKTFTGRCAHVHIYMLCAAYVYMGTRFVVTLSAQRCIVEDTRYRVNPAYVHTKFPRCAHSKATQCQQFTLWKFLEQFKWKYFIEIFFFLLRWIECVFFKSLLYFCFHYMFIKPCLWRGASQSFSKY